MQQPHAIRGFLGVGGEPVVVACQWTVQELPTPLAAVAVHGLQIELITLPQDQRPQARVDQLGRGARDPACAQH